MINEDGDITYEQTQARTKKSKSIIKRAIKRLKEAGKIIRNGYKCPKKRGRTSNGSVEGEGKNA